MDGQRWISRRPVSRQKFLPFVILSWTRGLSAHEVHKDPVHVGNFYSEPRTVPGIAEQGGRGMSLSSHTYFAPCFVHDLYVFGRSFASQSIF